RKHTSHFIPDELRSLSSGHSYYNRKDGAGGLGGGGRQAEDVISAVSTRLVNKNTSLYRGVRCYNADQLFRRRIVSPKSLIRDIQSQFLVRERR
ncbi:hypothetical protein ALC57_12034, partial [Trachymyrmex cornetzi]